MKKVALLFLASILFVSCAKIDTAFRNRVESAEFSASGTGNKAGNYGGALTTKLYFRNPRAKTADNK